MFNISEKFQNARINFTVSRPVIDRRVTKVYMSIRPRREMLLSSVMQYI